MRCIVAIFLAFVAAAQTRSAGFNDASASILPAHPIGANDLLLITVYGSPELTRTVRVSGQGEITLPLLESPIQVKGELPPQVETLIAGRLIEEEILVDPVVTVAIAEYTSRPITVAGAVKTPVTFQATGKVRLLEAISKAGGLTPEAGSEVLVSRGEGAEIETRRILVKALLSGADSSTNVILSGGEEIRVPEGGRVYVTGNVKKPGAFQVHENGSMTVLQVLALAEGLAPYSSKRAWILRPGSSGARQEIEVALSQIMKRKSTDVEVLPGDILYVPDNKSGRLGIAALERIVLFGTSAGATALIYAR